MRFALFALVATVCLAAVVESEKIRDLEGHHFQLRKTLGHFADEPYFRLYQHYAVKFITPLHPERKGADDYKNYVPSGDECVNFFTDFEANAKQVNDFDELVRLDACLGYLYQSEFHDEDKAESKVLADKLDSLINDEDYKQMFEATKVDDQSVVPLEGQKCIGNLLLDAILAKAQFFDETCNNAWIQVFVKFAECSNKIPEAVRENDSYLSVLFDLVKTRASGCFYNEIGTINTAVRDIYANRKLTRASNEMLKLVYTMRQQASNRMWPKPIQELLGAVQGVQKHEAVDTTTKHVYALKSLRNKIFTSDKPIFPEINLRTVSGIVRGVALNRDDFKNVLLQNMATYATMKIKPVKGTKAAIADPSGARRYKALVDDLCADFRSSDREDGYDFGLALVRTIRMLPHEKTLGVSEKDFIENVLMNARESAPLYLSVSSCNILTYTVGSFVPEMKNSGLKYEVRFTKDISNMVKWPVAGHF